MLARPPLLVAWRRISFIPVLKYTLTDDVVLQLVQPPVPGKLIPEAAVEPFIIKFAGLSDEPLANLQVKVYVPAEDTFAM